MIQTNPFGGKKPEIKETEKPPDPRANWKKQNISPDAARAKVDLLKRAHRK